MNYLLVWLSSMVIRLIGSTIRVNFEDRGGIINRPEHAPVIVAFWHNRVALMAYFFTRYCHGREALTFISRSRDGQFITNVAARFGIRAVRGSSSRHGMSAALAALRAAKDVHLDLYITPDGPRGPRYQIQPGLLRLAQLTHRPIVPVTYNLSWKHQLKSWDGFFVPLPFTVCDLVTGDPVFVPENASEAELEAITARITKALGGD
jgi:hypothetical protein